MVTVNKQSPIPYYHQLADILRAFIREANAANVDSTPLLLPSETELAAHHKITRATVRQAIDVLAREGLVYRVKGKGTFTAKPRSRYQLTQLIPTTDDILRRGWTPSIRLIAAQALNPSPPIAEALNLSADALVYEVCRLRLGNNEPLCVQWSYLPQQLYPNLLQQDLTQSLVYVLESTYGVYLWSAREVLRARLATDSEAKWLAIPAQSAVIHMERTTYSPEGLPLEFLQTIWRSDRYDFEFELKRAAP